MELKASPRGVIALLGGIVCGALALMALYTGLVRGDTTAAAILVAIAASCSVAIFTPLSSPRRPRDGEAPR